MIFAFPSSMTSRFSPPFTPSIRTSVSSDNGRVIVTAPSTGGLQLFQRSRAGRRYSTAIPINPAAMITANRISLVCQKLSFVSKVRLSKSAQLFGHEPAGIVDGAQNSIASISRTGNPIDMRTTARLAAGQHRQKAARQNGRGTSSR